MGAYLVINKENQTIPFRFATHQYQIYSNSEGKMVTKVIQVGLMTFAKDLDGYIKYIDDNQSKQLLYGSAPQAPSENWNNINF
jgi:hypothetical protein